LKSTQAKLYSKSKNNSNSKQREEEDSLLVSRKIIAKYKLKIYQPVQKFINIQTIKVRSKMSHIQS